MEIDQLPKLECEVIFLPRSPEGWGRDTVPVLSGDMYRPHFVVGDPNQRKAILTTRTYEIEMSDGSKRKVTSDKWIDEEYLGVAFHEAPMESELSQPIRAIVVLMYWPELRYEALSPNATFTIREGPTIVGFGEVLKWTEAEQP